MTNKNRIEKELLLECYDDYVGLWVAIRFVREVFTDADADEIRRLTLEVVQDLLETGLVQAGFPTPVPTPGGKNFEPWDASPVETITRIKSEWAELGREPNIGDIVWFVTNSEGDKRMKALREKLGRELTTDDMDQVV